MEKVTSIIFSILFFVLCFLPFALMPFAAKQEQSLENRALAEMPKIIVESKFNKFYFDELTDYVSDHFFFRNYLIGINSFLKEHVFSTSAVEKVVIGKEGWLFFSETLDDYSNTLPFTQHEINNISTTLRLIDDFVRSKRKTFVFFPVPNKNTIYDKYMPERYIKSNTISNAAAILNAQKDSGLLCLDILETFKNEQNASKLLNDKNYLYHKKDSHWNNKGALIAANEILSILGKEKSKFSDTDTSINKNFEGDLENMLYPSLGKKLDFQVDYDYTPKYTYVSKFRRPDDIIIRTSNEDAKDSLLMFRDSFGNALLPFLAEEFNSMYYSRGIPYNLNLLNAMDFDFVVLQIVERNLKNLLYSAPIMPAKPLNMSASDVIVGNDELFYRYHLDMLHVFGTIDNNYLEDDNLIFLIIETKDKNLCFEAFPIYEKSLIEDIKQNNLDSKSNKNENNNPLNGYSLYIDPSLLPKEDFNVSVVSVNSKNSRKSEVLNTDNFKNLQENQN